MKTFVETEAYKSSMGFILRKYREMSDLTQSQVANILGVSDQTYRLIEYGKMPIANKMFDNIVSYMKPNAALKQEMGFRAALLRKKYEVKLETNNDYVRSVAINLVLKNIVNLSDEQLLEALYIISPEYFDSEGDFIYQNPMSWEEIRSHMIKAKDLEADSDMGDYDSNGDIISDESQIDIEEKIYG